MNRTNDSVEKTECAAFPKDEIRLGVEAQSGVLTDVLLGKPDDFRWVPLNAISAVTFSTQDRTGVRFDKQKAMRQHREMVDAYEANGVRCHFVEADEGLPSSVFTRDSSFMTPWGAVIASIQTSTPADGTMLWFRNSIETPGSRSGSG